MNMPPDGAVPLTLDPALVLGILAFVWIGACILGLKLRRANTSEPRNILHAIRIGLKQARLEIERFPATREVHQILDAFDSVERTIDETEAVLAKSGR